MVTSGGRIVTGLSGKMRIQSLPSRFKEFVIARRAASIWREVTQAGDVALRPKLPYAREVPRVSTVRNRLRPFCHFRCFTFLGTSMEGNRVLCSPRSAAHGWKTRLDATRRLPQRRGPRLLGKNLAAINPDLYTNRS